MNLDLTRFACNSPSNQPFFSVLLVSLSLPRSVFPWTDYMGTEQIHTVYIFNLVSTISTALLKLFGKLETNNENQREAKLVLTSLVIIINWEGVCKIPQSFGIYEYKSQWCTTTKRIYRQSWIYNWKQLLPRREGVCSFFPIVLLIIQTPYQQFFLHLQPYLGAARWKIKTSMKNAISRILIRNVPFAWWCSYSFRSLWETSCLQNLYGAERDLFMRVKNTYQSAWIDSTFRIQMQSWTQQFRYKEIKFESIA
jgi:hypothetical protein